MRSLISLAAAAVILCSTLTAQAATIRIEADMRATSVGGAYTGVMTVGQAINLVIEYDSSVAASQVFSLPGTTTVQFPNVTRFDITTGGNTVSALTPGGPNNSFTEQGFSGLIFTADTNQSITFAGVANTRLLFSMLGNAGFFDSLNPAPTTFDLSQLVDFSFRFIQTTDLVNSFIRVRGADRLTVTNLDAIPPIPLPAGLPLSLGGLGLLAIARRRRRHAV